MGSAWKAISDDTRREILLLLKKKNMTPSEITKYFNFTFPAISSHLRILKEAELITEIKQGKNRIYSLNKDKTLEMMKFFGMVSGYQLRSIKEYVEKKRT